MTIFFHIALRAVFPDVSIKVNPTMKELSSSRRRNSSNLFQTKTDCLCSGRCDGLMNKLKRESMSSVNSRCFCFYSSHISKCVWKHFHKHGYNELYAFTTFIFPRFETVKQSVQLLNTVSRGRCSDTQQNGALRNQLCKKLFFLSAPE